MGLKLLDKLRLDFSHLNKHKIKTENCFDHKCLCNLSNKDTVYFCLCCHHYPDIRNFLLDEIYSFNKFIMHLSDTKLVMSFWIT